MKDKILSGMFGLCVGDAFGSKQKIKNRYNLTMLRDLPQYAYTLETSKSLAMADSLCKGVDFSDMKDKMQSWYDYCDHMNETTSTMRINESSLGLSCDKCSLCEPKNDTLKSILPLAFYLNKEFKDFIGQEQAMEIILEASKIESSSRMCFVSNTVYLAITNEFIIGNGSLKNCIQNGYEKAKAYFKANSAYANCINQFSLLEDVSLLATLSQDDLLNLNSVVYPLGVALYSLINSRNYQEAIETSEVLDRSISSITGSLAGLFYGYDNIPYSWIKGVSKIKLVEDIVNNLNRALGFVSL